jgi:hypothetical protein
VPGLYQGGALLIASCMWCISTCAQVLGTPAGQWTSMGVVSDGSYGIAPGMCTLTHQAPILVVPQTLLWS